MNDMSRGALSHLQDFMRNIRGGVRRSKNGMRESYELKVHLAQDEESGRWYVAESDIPGLWLEAETPAALIERIQQAAPELIELNQEEIIAACRARDASEPHPVSTASSAAAWRPVFDSPMPLAAFA